MTIHDERLQKETDANLREFMDSVVYAPPLNELAELESGLAFIGDALDGHDVTNDNFDDLILDRIFIGAKYEGVIEVDTMPAVFGDGNRPDLIIYDDKGDGKGFVKKKA